ncbi:MAG: T9SS type A sorting domain-containing protein [Candidatus Cloacimonetes bacterium]|nr:T9SS type A sorting domain-containing protein [Candidatus Cloacimonadota bacterium]
MRIVNLILILFLSSAILSASDGYTKSYHDLGNGKAELIFSIGTYSIGQVVKSGQNFSKIDFSSGITTLRKGYAELPYLNASIMLSADRDVEINVIPGESVEILLDHQLLPSRGVIYRNQDPAQIPYETDSSSIQEGFYPGDLATITEPFILRDIRGATIYVYPFQYDSSRQLLRIYREITIEITEKSDDPVNPLTKRDAIITREMAGIYNSVFINYFDTRDELTIDQFGEILVICTSRDELAIEPYIEWKREKGFNVEKIIVPAGLNVKDTIQDAYDLNNEILYVLLVGDWADIQSDTMSGAPMDPQLGCVVGTDQYPDICIGRFSASSPDQVVIQVEKVINYEKFPEIGGNWYDKAVGIASNQGPGDDGESDNQHNDVIWNNKLEPFTYAGYTPIYDPGANATMVANAVQAGTTLINYTGHGGLTGWSTSGFSNSNVSALSNGNKLPWIVSVACNTGEFNSGECFGEAWLKNDNGGAIMFLGATISQPWDPPMRGQDYFADILIGGYDYDLYPGQNGINTEEQRTILGAIVYNGLVLMTTEAGDNQDWETAKTWTYFGDPALQIRSAAPLELDLTNQTIMTGIPFTTNVSSVEGSFEGALVSLSQGDNYFSAFTDAEGNVEIAHDLSPGNALLVVTGFNTETVYQEISVIPPDGPYVIYQDYSINDPDGNQNGLADYGETISLDFTIHNVGVETAYGVDVEISSEDDYLTLVDANENFGNLEPGSSLTQENAFIITLSDDIPDLHQISFLVSITDGDQTWLSNFGITAHAPILTLSDFSVSDPEGNGNGNLDPGETAQINISIENIGSAQARSVYGNLLTDNEYIIINADNLLYGDLDPLANVEQSFTVTVSEDAPVGCYVDFAFDISADQGISGQGNFNLIIGQIPVLLLDFDDINSSIEVFQNTLEGLSVAYETYSEIPEDIDLYASVFVCLGVYTWQRSYVLTSDQGEALAAYLDNGGNIYMEGGDTWYFDPSTAVHPYFHINGDSDGSSDLGTILGQGGTFTEGMSFGYSGDNNWVDHISPVGSAELIFQNQSPEYGCGISYEGEMYKSIGVSFEFGGLTETNSTKLELLASYLDFFGIPHSLVDVEQVIVPGKTVLYNNYPNPFNPETNIAYSLDHVGMIKLEIYNIRGQKVRTLVSENQIPGDYTIIWDGRDDQEKAVSSGVYFYSFRTDSVNITRKMILMK